MYGLLTLHWRSCCSQYGVPVLGFPPAPECSFVYGVPVHGFSPASECSFAYGVSVLGFSPASEYSFVYGVPVPGFSPAPECSFVYIAIDQSWTIQTILVQNPISSRPSVASILSLSLVSGSQRALR